MTNKTVEHLSPPEKTVWRAVLVSEFIAIFLTNAVTLIVFARNHHLRKRTTYLIINLTVADLLTGAVSGPLEIFYVEMDPEPGFSWQKFSILILYTLFAVCSLCHLSLIALERLHATLFPFRHCLIGEWFYLKTTICSWLLAFVVVSVDAVIALYAPDVSQYPWTSFVVLTILILTVSYVIIFVKMKNSPLPHYIGAPATERKLSVTLFIVTVVSMLTILPWVIYVGIPFHMWNELSKTARLHITYTVLYYACSLVNPFTYAIRMKMFRKAVYKALICRKNLESSHVQPIALHPM